MAKLTKVENLVVGSGIMKFALYDGNGVVKGRRDLGEVNEFGLNGESERLQVYSSRGGIGQIILDQITKLTLGGEFTVIDMSIENQALFLAATVSTRTQAATPITNERIYNAESGLYYPLGRSTSNPAGVKVVTAVTIGLYELVNAAVRVNTTAYALGVIFKSSTNVFLVTTAGTTAGSAPTYDVAAVGNSTTDGTAVVKFLGTTSNFVVDTDYKLDSDQAEFGIVVGGNLGLACALYTSVTGNYLSFNAGYTPQANSRKQAATTGAAQLTGELYWEATNPIGIKDNILIAKCTLSASGDSQFVTADAVRAFTLAIGVSQLNSDVPQVLVDGEPYT